MTFVSKDDEENQLSQVSTNGASSQSDGPKKTKKQTQSSGYHKLSHTMSKMLTLAMFRRFGSLNALSLLFYQAELMKLEQEFADQASVDDASEDKVHQLLSKDWSLVSTQDKQWELMTQIRSVLERYRDQQLLVQHKLVKLQKPCRRDIEYMRKWMHRTDMGFIRLKGPDRRAWRYNYKTELVALDSKPPDDLLTRYTTKCMVDIYHFLIGQHIHKSAGDEDFGNSVLYDQRNVSKVVSLTMIGLSSMVPLSSIYLLDHFEDPHTRMIILAIYTVGFSIILAAVSGAKRLEVFSAAAAFAAVQVVFISKDD